MASLSIAPLARECRTCVLPVHRRKEKEEEKCITSEYSRENTLQRAEHFDANTENLHLLHTFMISLHN